MRKVMFLLATALIAGVAASFAVSSATATAGDPAAWYTVSMKLTPGMHTLKGEATVTNIGTITHTARVTISLVGTLPFPTVKLAPGQTWRWAWAAVPVHAGTYTATITAVHVFEKGDPLPLLGAITSASSTAVVP